MGGRLYGSIVVLVLGGCIGSFLNVVIYRLPRGLALHRPGRSFCPSCGGSIAWYDNIPVLSYLGLGGRCRRCRWAIPLRYPLVELATSLVFLMLYDALFVARLREGVAGVAADWPLWAAHAVLLGGLIALAVMDLEAYLVDVRLTWVMAAAGVAAHAVWTPASSVGQEGPWGLALAGAGGWLRPGVVQGVLALAGAVGLGIGALVSLRRGPAEMLAEGAGPTEVGEGTSPGAEDVYDLAPRRPRRWHLPALIGVLVLVVGYVAVMVWQGRPVPLDGWFEVEATVPGTLSAVESPVRGGGEASMLADPAVLRLVGGLVLCFVGLVLVSSWPQPQADAEILEAIDAEAGAARHNALWELKLLAPAMVLSAGAAVGLWVVGPAGRQAVWACLQWSPTGDWRPLWGLATGLTGWILGGAIGWLARIVFTLAFGKEALGMGDVHILAAAGAVAGWPVALMGFFLAAPLALLGIVVIALRRQSRALPYGPWLALAFLVVCLFQDVWLRYARVRWLLE